MEGWLYIETRWLSYDIRRALNHAFDQIGFDQLSTNQVWQMLYRYE